MLIPKPFIVWLFQKSDHEIINERLSEHEKQGIQMKDIRVTDEKKTDSKYKGTSALNESVEEDTPLVKATDIDMQQHLSLKAAQTLRASLQGKEPEDFLTLVKEGLG
jgi:hypothetical protein